MAIPQLTRKLSERENSFPGLSIKQPTSLEDISVHFYMHAVAYLGFHFGGGSKFFWKVGVFNAWRFAPCSAWQSHAFVRGHAPPRKFLKMVQFGAF